MREDGGDLLDVVNAVLERDDQRSFAQKGGELSCGGFSVVRFDAEQYHISGADEGRILNEAIAKVEGVDGVFIGPSDLGASLGHLSNPQHADVQTAMQDAVRRLTAIGKPAGILTGNEEEARRYIDWGYLFVAVGADVGLLAEAGAAHDVPPSVEYSNVESVQWSASRSRILKSMVTTPFPIEDWLHWAAGMTLSAV